MKSKTNTLLLAVAGTGLLAFTATLACGQQLSDAALTNTSQIDTTGTILAGAYIPNNTVTTGATAIQFNGGTAGNPGAGVTFDPSATPVQGYGFGSYPYPPIGLTDYGSVTLGYTRNNTAANGGGGQGDDWTFLQSAAISGTDPADANIMLDGGVLLSGGAGAGVGETATFSLANLPDDTVVKVQLFSYANAPIVSPGPTITGNNGLIGTWTNNNAFNYGHTGGYYEYDDTTSATGTLQIQITADPAAYQYGGAYLSGLIVSEAAAVLPPQWNAALNSSGSGSGDWNVGTNWTGDTAPNGIGKEADFFGKITSRSTVYMDAPVTVGTINFNNASPYVIAGSSSLTLQTSTGSANIIVQQGTDYIGPIGGTFLASNTTLNVASGATLNFSGPVTLEPGVTVSQTGAGTLHFAGTVSVLSGATVAFATDTTDTLSVASGGNASVAAGSTLTVYNLNVAGGGTLDVGTGQVDVNYAGSTPLATIDSDIHNGSIVSSAANAHEGVGSLDNGSTIELKLALLGDTNLDGSVNFADLLTIAQHYGQSGQIWATGDTNYDGTINFTDLLNLAQNYGQTLPAGSSQFSPSFAADWNLAVSEAAAVPEPASFGILTVSALGLLNRRKRVIR